MAEEIITTPGGDPTPNNQEYNTVEDYIAAIARIKEGSVPREDYDKLQNEKKLLLEKLVTGGTIAANGAKPAPVDVAALRKELYSSECNLSNLEYWEKTLTLRDAIIEQTGKDPFLPSGQKIAATAEDVQKADNVAKIVRECIDYANGDSRVFTNELNRRTVDVVAPRARRR